MVIYARLLSWQKRYDPLIPLVVGALPQTTKKRVPMRKPYFFIAILTGTLGLGYAGYQFLHYKHHDPRVLSPHEVDESITYSNILPVDYVGPATCAECHPTQHTRWKTHPHAVMNQMASPLSIKGDFSDVEITLPGGKARFYTDTSGRYFMTVNKDGQKHRQYVVTRTVGSRYMQFYIGRQLYGPESEDDPIYREHMLPFSYWFKMKRWYPRQYFDPDGDEVLHEGIPQIEAIHKRPDVRLYTAVCMNCHNTYPYAYKIFNHNFVGFPDATMRAAVEPLSEVLSKDIEVKPTAESFSNMVYRMDPEKHLVTMGISCESCHFGGREHAIHQKKIRFLPTSKYVQVKSHDPDNPLTAERKNPITVMGICIQCHSGNGKRYPNGAGKGNSREGLDFRLGFCTSELRCVDCHDPHRPSEGPSGGPTKLSHLALCVKCHDQYADQKAALAHSKHSLDSGVNCMDCHMPRYTQGLDDLIRTHRITNPVEVSMVSEGSANACNLCHLDKSLRWTLKELEKGWGTRIEPQSNWKNYSQLDEPVGDYWLNGEDNHLRLVATQCYARSPLGKKKLPDLIRCLNDSEPINRVFHSCAVQKLCGREPHSPLGVNITASPVQREQQIEALLTKMGLLKSGE